MKKENRNNINRRSFLKVLGSGVFVSTAVFYGCKPERKSADHYMNEMVNAYLNF